MIQSLPIRLIPTLALKWHWRARTPSIRKELNDMMYDLNWCGIYMPIWLLCLILGGRLGVVLGKLVELILRQTKLLTVDYASLPVIFAFVFGAVFFLNQ